MNKKFITLLLFAISFTAFAQQNPVLPIDPEEKKGNLENGLQY